MSAKTDYLENAILGHILGKGTLNFTSPPNLFVALHTQDPTEVGNIGELSGNGYARQSITFQNEGGGIFSNSGQLVFTASGGNWGSITHTSIWDASSAGNPLYYGALTTPRTINDTESLVIAIGNLTVQEL